MASCIRWNTVERIGAAERSRGLSYLAIALLVAAVAILMGVFLTD